MNDFTIITPNTVFRVQARSYLHAEQAATDAGFKVLGIHREGDRPESAYQPGYTPKGTKRPTAVSQAFDAAGGDR